MLGYKRGDIRINDGELTYHLKYILNISFSKINRFCYFCVKYPINNKQMLY